jgi:N-acetylneuraminic acid mutarotase
MITARNCLASGVVSGEIYTIGGADTVSSSSCNEAYDAISDTWAVKADMPTARFGLAAGTVNGRVYTFGGYGGGILFANEEYDPMTDMWTAKADMPTERWGLGIAVVSGILYAIGGWGNGGISSANEAYDPITDTWTTLPPMQTPRMGFGIAVKNGKIYVIGGFNGLGVHLSTNEMYDPMTDTWTTKADMPTARGALGTGILDEKIYAIGGANSSNWLSTNEAYDPQADTVGGTPWTIKTPMPTPRSWLTIAVVNNKIYAIGGTNGSNTVLAANEEYTPDVGIAEHKPSSTLKPFLSISPNPFSTKTEIRYRISEITKIENRNFPISLCIYDVSGRFVKNFAISNFEFPVSEVSWDGRNDNGKILPSGIYYIRLSQGSFTETRKLLFVK